MPKTNQTLNKELDELLSSHGFDVKALTSGGDSVPVPEEADIFQFHFHKNGKDYGTVTVTIDGDSTMIVYYDDNVTRSGNNDTEDISWTELVKQLKKFALGHQIKNFKLKDTDRLRTDMERREHVRKQESTLNEGYYGNKHTSYNDIAETVKIIVKHNKKLEETDARFRYIDKIFLETSQGERLLVPTTKPSQARMFARHIIEGGGYRDDRWSHLQEMCEDIDKLGKFVRATNGKREMFTESAGRMIDEAIAKYQELREHANKLQTSRGYNAYFESYEPSVITETDDTLSEVFKTSSLDARIESALPVLQKYGFKAGKLEEASMFAEWADDILSEALDPLTNAQVEELIKLLSDEEFKVGPNGENAIKALDDIIESGELEEELRDAADQDADYPASPVIISWMQRQPGSKYKTVLAQVSSDEANADASEKSSNEQPQKVKPKKKKPQQPPADAGGLPPLPPLPPAPAGGSAPPPAGGGLPPLPPLGESDELSELLKLLK
jgi:hypothetical protein